MKAASASRAPAAARPAPASARALGVVAAGAGGITLLIRLALAYRSFDLFGDEVIYTGLGHSVVSGGFPRNGEGPFFLHPPGFFYLEAGWIRLLGYPADVIARVNEMRTLNALLGAATAVVLVLLAARAGSLRAAMATGLLFAFDPFSIRQNDRVMIETAMMLWVLLGYLALAPLAGRPPRRQAWARAAVAGVLFGFAMLTKDEAVLITVLPLAGAAALRWGPRRLVILLTAGTAMATYGVYVAAVAAAGEIGTLWAAKTTGARRMLGLIQITGFNSPGAPPLVGRLTAEGRYFGPTYIVLALAVPALVLLLRRGSPMQRMLGLLYIAAAVTLGYSLILGTLEENELYLLLVPSLLILPAAATLGRRDGLPRRKPAGQRRPTPRTAVISAVLLVVLVLNLATCLQWLLRPDDGYAQLRQYMAAHLPAGTGVASVDDSPPETPGTTYWALGDRYHVGPWVTPAARSREHIRYIVVPWAEIRQRYSYLTTAQVRSLVHGDRLVFSFVSRTYGDLALYQLPETGHAR